MPIEIIKKNFDAPNSLAKKDNKPTLTTWKNVDMIRNHSIQAAARQIIQSTKSIDVVKIGIIGEPSTGKTELAKTLAHLFHKISHDEGRENYAVKSFDRDDLMNLEQTFGSLSPTNYIMRFQDLSFLGAGATKKEIDQVSKTVTEIRHLKNQKDVKVILIYDYHYSKGFPKYLRQAHYRFFTSMGSEEQENMEKIVGTRHKMKLDQFKRMGTEILKRQKASFLVKKKWFIYSYKNPFVPVLFWDEDSLRFVVFPLRSWIDPICSICSTADNPDVQTELSLPEVKETLEKTYGRQNILSALKVKLFVNGINTYDRRAASAGKFIDKMLESRTTNLEDLAVAFDLKIKKHRLRQKVEDILD
jgi:hypothetical protein